MIDPKQKAVEIVNKYRNQKVSVLYYEHSIPNIVHAEMLDKSAIECAKIAVNEIIEVLSISAISISHRIQEESYWQEVLNELNKM